MHEWSQAFVSDRLGAPHPCSGSARWSDMMDSTPVPNGHLQDFLLDAQVLLSGAHECLQHLELIGNDPDAYLCLDETLDTLAQRSNTLGLNEVAHFSRTLQQLLAPACNRQHLDGVALPALGACLTLLAWQLELLDPYTGRLGMDTDEQQQLLDELASLLDQPSAQTCAQGVQLDTDGHQAIRADAQRPAPSPGNGN
jgi:chemotaxis protein histidine kinase CheA